MLRFSVGNLILNFTLGCLKTATCFRRSDATVESQVDLRATASVWCKSRLVCKYKKSLRTFGPNRIHLCWVADHSGILGNETANALARLGSLSGG